MMNALRALDADGARKISCFDNDSSELQPGSLVEKPVLSFIDGEHTVEATRRDFAFCAESMKYVGVIVFHDAPVVYHALQHIITDLEKKNIRFRAYALPNTLFCIELGDDMIYKNPKVSELLAMSYRSYFIALDQAEWVRKTMNNPVIKLFRSIKHRIQRKNIND